MFFAQCTYELVSVCVSVDLVGLRTHRVPLGLHEGWRGLRDTDTAFSLDIIGLEFH